MHVTVKTLSIIKFKETIMNFVHIFLLLILLNNIPEDFILHLYILFDWSE